MLHCLLWLAKTVRLTLVLRQLIAFVRGHPNLVFLWHKGRNFGGHLGRKKLDPFGLVFGSFSLVFVQMSCSDGVERLWPETFRFEDENDQEIWFKVFFTCCQKINTPEFFIILFLPEKVALLLLLEEFKTSPNCKMLKLPTIDNLFPPLRHSR